MTLEEWGLLDEERREWVDGVLVEERMPAYLHDFVVTRLTVMLDAWAGPRGGIVVGSGPKFGVSARRGRIPDVTVYLRGARRPPLRGLIRAVPSIAVEVVTPTPRDERRDRIEKVAEYAGFGIRWYWLVDPEVRSVEILELGSDGRYVIAAAVTEGRIEQVPGCEGLVVDVAGLWAAIDALAAEVEEG
jgi:Uma2 family endonuclease